MRNLVRVTMLKTVDANEQGTSKNLPPDLANKLIASGAAKLEGTKPAVGPTEFKPAAPSQVKAPVK